MNMTVRAKGSSRWCLLANHRGELGAALNLAWPAQELTPSGLSGGGVLRPANSSVVNMSIYC